MDSCLFCRIVAGTIPATIVRETPRAIAFRDVDPKAPTHILIVPRDHIDSVDSPEAEDGALWADIIGLARGIARSLGLSDDGYRLVINHGRDGGQSVAHLHVHVLAGRRLGWPPG
ncbi:MAG: histidine triad nucleotide-binding protein [Chloroflexota bacterium]|nr:MAG: histidine triad nucleotide-binding protein [Chloroflexota bacterium]